ncbi:ERF family protein, partial [Dysgonomonas capnocytophagoides]|uniref:ERF family protein n=1 Tax=Dysgonomonas capnocytophagoides TaxID=45254 RepID=UPI002A809EFB
AVKDAETKFKLVSIPVKQKMIKSEIVKSMKDNGNESINYVDIIKMTLRIIDLESIKDFIEIESFGRGLDTADKGFGKASTYARKYALLNAYKIATGEDPDKDKEKPQFAVKEDEKRDAVINYMMTDNNYLQNILSYFNVGTIDDLDKKEINTIYSNLQKKGKL